MAELISRQAAIGAVEGITSSMSICVNSDECHGMKRMQRQAVIELANIPSAQPELIEKTAYIRGFEQGRTQGMIDSQGGKMNKQRKVLITVTYNEMGIIIDTKAEEVAQPEIIRCKDCGKREVCRTSTVWAVAPGDDWFCADAERRTDG